MWAIILLAFISSILADRSLLTLTEVVVDSAEDLDIILNGVNSVSIDGTPGLLSVYGQDAFTVLAGKAGGENVSQPLIAGSRLRQGRILASTHDAFLTDDDSDLGADKNTLILNSVKWVSPDGVSQPRVAVLTMANLEEGDSLVTFLNNNDIPATLLDLEGVVESSQLVGDFDVVCTREFFDESKVPIFRKFADNGGGLLIGVTSWAYYFFLNVTGHFGTNFPPNMLASEAGIVWHDDSSYASSTNPDGSYDASRSLLLHTHVLDVWEVIRNFLITNEFSGDLEENPLQFSTIFQNGLRFVPPGDSIVTDEFYDDAKNFTQAGGQPVATQENPVVGIGDKFKLQLYFALSNYVLNPEDVTAHPGSSYFPGSVQIPANYPASPIPIKIEYQKPGWAVEELRKTFVSNSISDWHTPQSSRRRSHLLVDENFEFNTRLPQWFSTGLYAPAGAVIKLDVIDGDEEILKNFQIQIGSHTDDISGKQEWYRSPEIVIRRQLENNSVTLANPYGGLIYVIIPDEAITGEEQIFSAVVSGSVRAPRFKLGQTSVKEWRDTIRHEIGAWAEFETDNLVLSAPRGSAEVIENPEELLVFWDEVMDAIADLAAIPRKRYRQERIVPDILISAGFMHSGHNHQQSSWTFSGTTEVTCNLFALYVYNNICGIPSEETRSEMTPTVYRETVSEFIENGRLFSEWQGSPFLALLFYHQLQMEYGWTAFKQVFAQYHDIESEPSTMEDQIDLWMIMFSRQVEENLSEFFHSWGIPVSANATGSIADLPSAIIQIGDLLQD